MKVSLNWIREFTNIDLPVDELVEKTNAQLGAVEEVKDFTEKYQGSFVVKVVECVKHPNADKLSLCLIDDGGCVKGVERNKDRLIQVVCGAPNVKAGMLAVWLPPGATVPSTYEKDRFVLEAREIRGQVSNGMLASAKELDLGDDHSGIVEITGKVAIGQPFGEYAGLDDTVIDIENKMFTHRPDLFGVLGVARELAGIQDQSFKSMPWYKEDADLHNDGRKNVLKLAVKNDLPKLVPRFTAIAIKDIKVGQSPLWLKARLVTAGIRPINNIVDITNYLMHETAQPLHAYDYDKVKTGVLGVREAKDGETVTVIGGKEIKLKAGVIVITDGAKPIGLGGVMGGADTEVDERTKNIIIEVANFDMNRTRRTAMEYGLFTDAATRFTKNQSSRQQRAVLCRAVDCVKVVAGGRVASPIVDINHAKTNEKAVEVSVNFINSRLGVKLTAAEIKKLLENVEFKVTGSVELKITAPFWRTDIEIAEDIVEEVGRLYGYDNLPLELPNRPIQPASQNEMIAFKNQIRQILTAAGANEVLTYSFVHGQLLDKVGQKTADSYHIKNALSPDLQYYRQTLAPSLLEKIHPNIKAGFDKFALFEIGRGHVKGMLDAEGLPEELQQLALVVASKNKTIGAPYYVAKTYCDHLLTSLGAQKVDYVPVNSSKTRYLTYYEPKRAAEIMVNGKRTGIVGEFKPAVGRALKLPLACAGFEIDITNLSGLAQPKTYTPLNKYPEITQDLCLRMPAEVDYQTATDFLIKQLETSAAQHGYKFSVTPIDIFQKQDDLSHKQITWHIALSHPDRTLTTEEANKLFAIIDKAAEAKLKAERI